LDELVKKMMKAGLYGEHTHINPIELIESLNPEESKICVNGYPHSMWDLLHHLVNWQDFTIKALDGEEPDWRKVQDADWLDSDYPYKKEDFQKLVKDFINGLRKIEARIDSVDLKKSYPALGNSTGAYSILVDIQHNSYHLGQILLLRNLISTKES
jgi:uncharacterized damage-inducible protein DinB